MPKRASKKAFVAEFPLKTNDADAQALNIRIDAGRQIFNAVLGECLKRLRAMRADPAWSAARELPTNTPEERQAKWDAYAALRIKHRLLANLMQKYAETCRDACWIGDHIGSHDTQAAATRAFAAVERYMFRTGGRPRFKTKGAMRSVEGKSNEAVIRYREEKVTAIHYYGLVLPLRLDRKDKKQWQANALGHHTKYCRIVRRVIRGRERWFVQLVQRGTAPRVHDSKDGVVGTDVGPSTIAVVSAHSASLQQFCPTVQQPWKAQSRIERAMDRSRRATNPERFDERGRWIKRQKGEAKQKLQRSSRYLRLATERRERERCISAERDRAHGELQNDILSQGRHIKSEKVSYKGWQKNFGRSSKVRAPGSFMAGLKRKASGAGGYLLDIGTRTTRLSQFDHTTGDHLKKELSERTHYFRDGVTEPIQRDLYSAFLATCCDADTLDVSQVRASWTAAEPLLRRAMSRNEQRAKERAPCPPRAGTSRRARRPSKGSASTRRRPDKGPVAAHAATGSSPT